MCCNKSKNPTTQCGEKSILKDVTESESLSNLHLLFLTLDFQNNNDLSDSNGKKTNET